MGACGLKLLEGPRCAGCAGRGIECEPRQAPRSGQALSPGGRTGFPACKYDMRRLSHTWEAALRGAHTSHQPGSFKAAVQPSVDKGAELVYQAEHAAGRC
jgi:hypothetical protein